MKNFFANLKTKRGKSLDTTRLVLKDGRRLKPMVEELQSFISNGKKKSEIRKKTRQVIADCQSQTDAIKGSSELKIPQEMELADGENAINCAVCDVSCYLHRRRTKNQIVLPATAERRCTLAEKL